MNINPDLVFYAGSTLLEGPCWDAKDKVIYCVSIEQCLIYRIEPYSGNVRTIQANGQVGCAVICEDGSLLSAEKGGLYRTNIQTGQRKYLRQLELDPAMRYNDGKIDPRGRFLVGTKGFAQDLPGRGRLFSFDGAEAKILVDGTTISNGIGFSRVGDFMYFIDTPTRKVARYHYNLEDGTAVFDRYVIAIDGNGWPDGMCVDVDDMIWVAEWGGGRVSKWDPLTGKRVQVIDLPCTNVTSCCLGGVDYSDLYVTTAKSADKSEALAGGLFRIQIHRP